PYAANAGNTYTATILASDGRGGTREQTFMVTVTTGTALAALAGTKYSDQNGNGQRDPTAPPPSGLAPIALQQAAIADTPFALDYHQPTNSMLIVAAHNNGTPGLYRVQPDGTELLYASLPGLPLADGTSLTTVRPGKTAGFTTGDVFVAGASSGTPPNQTPAIMKVTAGGATVVNSWAR